MNTDFDKVKDLIAIVLNSVSQELHVAPDELSIEVESVVTRGMIEAYKRGAQDGGTSERPTVPAPRPSRIPTPRPRKHQK